ncbi:Cation transport P-ATPase [Candidatus Phytoplasma australiense]|uniref:Magnesium-transporting ATPase, P-type 1 n=1 Tax=Phytoplasma australiense TaxID=59748 RepID=B1V8Z2_PHYAS|nr:Cation transport P-ATPase [Candidatus Phytoplasma australiense]
MKKKNLKQEETINFLQKASIKSNEEIFQTLESSWQGLDQKQILFQRNLYGPNLLSKEKNKNFCQKIIKLIFTPFNLVLIILMVVSLVNDVAMPLKNSQTPSYAVIITTLMMFLISLIIQFTQENKYLKITSQLQKLVQNTTSVKRQNQNQKIPLEEVVRGDIILLAAGDIVPADLKLLETKDFFVKTTTFTGESEPVEKKAQVLGKYNNFLEDPRLVLTSSIVISGYATGIVVLTGKDTYLGKINKEIHQKKEISHLDSNLNKVAKLLFICISLMSPLVFLFNIYKNNSFSFLQTILFTLTIAFGLTPKMLPLIITTSFFKGIVALSKKKVIVKNLNVISSFGSMNVLFTDKTGTLTEDKVFLENFCNLEGQQNITILKHAYLNSFFQTGLKSLIDEAIISKAAAFGLTNTLQQFKKIDEIPFDFKRRKMSVVVENQNNNQKMITKGAIEEILNICDSIIIQGQTSPLTLENKKLVLDQTKIYNQKGMRVIGVAQKNIIQCNGPIQEEKMTLIGLLTFLDPIKESSIKTIASLHQKKIIVKILTGDNEILTKTVAQKLNIDATHCLQGDIVDQLDDETLYQEAQKTNLFIKLSPEQKARIVSLFKKKGNIVAFMGDGINDAFAMKKADVGICVNTGAEITKEIADIILLEKQLDVLENGIIEGRKTYTNAIKYIKFTLASNFGNSLSVLLASFYLPFQPMLVLQILFLDLIYDLICFSIPFDNVDENYLKKPSKFDFKNIKNFMLWFGIISFLVDFSFLLGMGFLGKSGEAQKKLFQTSWFIFSIWSQTLTLFLLRTDKFFVKKKFTNLPSPLIIICSAFGLIVATIAPRIEFIRDALQLDGNFFLSSNYHIWLLLFFLLFFYSFVMVWAKIIFIKKNKQLL